jgi:BirA family biotin operon repressor/biotin-[acetyl-CoA-carboxylase] ligase
MPLAKQKLIILESVDSTNNYAMALVQKGGAESGDAVLAMEQTAGKGTRGKYWRSKKGDNIIVSIMVQMQWLQLKQQFELSISVAVACFNFFSKYINEDVKIKWPNDIFINDRKAGGILIENIIKGNLWQWSVIGIGLNINQTGFEKDNLKAISLKDVTGKNYDIIELSKELHEIVLKNLQSLQSGNLTKMLAWYNENLFCKNKKITLRKGNIVFETTIEKVASTGELITKDCIERRFVFGEIEWLL